METSRPYHFLTDALSLLEAAFSQEPLAVLDTFAVPQIPGHPHPLLGAVVGSRHIPLAVVGLTKPDVAVDAAPVLEFLSLKARAQRAPYMAVFNLRDAALRPTPKLGTPAVSLEPLRRYATLLDIAPQADSLSHPMRLQVQRRIEEIMRDLLTLHTEGRLDLVVPDATFFVQRLLRAVEVLKPHLKDALAVELRYKPQFAHQLESWAI